MELPLEIKHVKPGIAVGTAGTGDIGGQGYLIGVIGILPLAPDLHTVFERVVLRDTDGAIGVGCGRIAVDIEIDVLQPQRCPFRHNVILVIAVALSEAQSHCSLHGFAERQVIEKFGGAAGTRNEQSNE